MTMRWGRFVIPAKAGMTMRWGRFVIPAKAGMTMRWERFVIPAKAGIQLNRIDGIMSISERMLWDLFGGHQKATPVPQGGVSSKAC